jgi:hypothetical protein
MRIGVALLSTTKSPPPRKVTKEYRLVESMMGQMGALSGRRSGSWHGNPFGVVQLARSIPAAVSRTKVFVG